MSEKSKKTGNKSRKSKEFFLKVISFFLIFVLESELRAEISNERNLSVKVQMAQVIGHPVYGESRHFPRVCPFYQSYI